MWLFWKFFASGNSDLSFKSTQIGLNIAFDTVVSGERVITTGEKTAGYQAVINVLGNHLQLVDFADFGFEVNSGKNDIIQPSFMLSDASCFLPYQSALMLAVFS